MGRGKHADVLDRLNYLDINKRIIEHGLNKTRRDVKLIRNLLPRDVRGGAGEPQSCGGAGG